MKMKSANPKLLTGRHALMLAVTIQALVAVDRAEACTVGALPSSFASGATVDCSGDTKNSSPDPKIGYGTFNDNNNTYNINAGAKVTGDDTGVRFSTGAKFNISGTITGTNVDGITGHDDVTGDASTAIMTNTSTGIISGHNGIAVGTLDLHNAGQIRGLSSDGRAINAGSVNIVNADTGIISSPGTGINAFTVDLNNAGTIEATGPAGVAIGAVTINVTANSNKIKATATGGIAIQAAGTVTVNNSIGGLITGDKFAVNAATVNVTGNSGAIQATGTFGIGIKAGTVIVTGNTGTISGGSQGIVSNNADITNSKLITGDDGGIFANHTATVANSGTISGTGTCGSGIEAGTGTVIVTGNTGTISGVSFGILSNNADITNSSRTGTISGNIAIQADGFGGMGSTITTAGAIVSTAGASGTAIKLSAAADTLTLLTGSRIVGVVDMGDVAKVGNDTVNVVTVAPSSKVSSLTTAAALPTFIHFSGVTNYIFSGGGFTGPTVQSGTQLATLDPTALAQADRTLMDFTGGVSSLVQGRLNGVAPSANGAVMAMSYAPESGGNAGPFAKATDKATGINPAWLSPAPITVWA